MGPPSQHFGFGMGSPWGPPGKGPEAGKPGKGPEGKPGTGHDSRRPGMGAPWGTPGKGPAGGAWQGPKPPSAGDLFDRFDKNKDGKLTKDELPGPLWDHLSKSGVVKDNAITKEGMETAMKKLQEQFRGKLQERGSSKGPQGAPGADREKLREQFRVKIEGARKKAEGHGEKQAK
jgi:hypothetical protein